MRAHKILTLVTPWALVLTHGVQGQTPPAPLTDADFYDNGAPHAHKVELGRLLFYDKILSGNENISCATCHHGMASTSDGLSLPVGEGGTGLSVTRDTGVGVDAVRERVPRNSPALFNLGAREFEFMFHDGRVTIDPDQPSGFLSPAGETLPPGIDNVLAAQAMFPVTSGAEMAGQYWENPQGLATSTDDLPGVWDYIASKLQAIPEYVTKFAFVFDDEDEAADITYVHAANAIAAFEADAWRADNSPFDRFLRGEHYAMSSLAKLGMKLFYGNAGCSRCHAGALQTDHGFHAIAMPQIGPGKGDGPSGHEDFGRTRETGDPADMYKFRTPSLRNVELTGPWGHAGSHATLRAVMEHHFDPLGSLENYDPSQTVLPFRQDLANVDFQTHENPTLRAKIALASELTGVQSPQEHQVDALMRFMEALTDPAMRDLRHNVPMRVPSGLPVFD